MRFGWMIYQASIMKDCCSHVWSFHGCCVVQGGVVSTMISLPIRQSSWESLRFHWRCAWGLLSGILLLLQSSCGLAQFNVSFIDKASNQFAIYQCDRIDNTWPQSVLVPRSFVLGWPWCRCDYAVDLSTYKYLNGGIGKDWAEQFLHKNMERFWWATTTSWIISQVTSRPFFVTCFPFAILPDTYQSDGKYKPWYLGGRSGRFSRSYPKKSQGGDCWLA